ncbi:MAG: RDD family protein, partial [Acidobacteriaceae bacterium]|nr:RDD family protein [Acidobacteriaceae bacterium]
MPLDQPVSQPAYPLHYGGFWPRFAALCLDSLLMVPMALLGLWAFSSRFYLLLYLVLDFVFQVWYDVYLVGRWGGTPGKLLLGLRIRKTSGEPVGSREALWRAAPDLLFSLVGAIALYVASLQIDPSHYRELSFLDRLTALNKPVPAWYHPLDILQNVWNWGELVVLLTNRKRRALHDFLAGTVVV